MFSWLNRYVGSLESKAILITGCDTGFGRLMALNYCQQGALVFAACLTEEHAQTLKNEAKGPGVLITVMLDVTKEDQIQKAFEFVKAELKGKPLYALINNAGIFSGFYVEMTPMAEYRKSMEINFFGHIGMVKTFLPMIQNPGGRIVSVISLSGVYALRGASAYSASKFAVNAFLDSLRNELRNTGIKVIKIMPGGHKTPGAANYTGLLKAEERWQEATEDVKARYPSDLIEVHVAKSHLYEKYWGDPMQIVKAVQDAMLLKNPNCMYLVGNDAVFLGRYVTQLPISWQDYIQACL